VGTWETSIESSGTENRETNAADVNRERKTADTPVAINSHAPTLPRSHALKITLPIRTCVFALDGFPS
jgi:hypothetical protein